MLRVNGLRDLINGMLAQLSSIMSFQTMYGVVEELRTTALSAAANDLNEAIKALPNQWELPLPDRETTSEYAKQRHKDDMAKLKAKWEAQHGIRD